MLISEHTGTILENLRFLRYRFLKTAIHENNCPQKLVLLLILQTICDLIQTFSIAHNKLF